MLDVTIDENAIRIGRRFAVNFQRTLRIPDDGRTYPLPPGLGALPILKVEDYSNQVPPIWREQGGVFIPMYQREALWLSFNATAWKPNAVKVGIGRVNAISGEPYDDALHADPQDYIVCPDQPWLDGVNTGHGSIRQFVAMPLGLGYTVEASITGAEKFGGIEITVFEPKPGKFPEKPPINPEIDSNRLLEPKPVAMAVQQMGLGAGGVMRQKIYSDPYGIEVWDQGNYEHVVVHIVNSAQFFEITGIEPPPTPIDAKTYAKYRLPWFDLYDEVKEDVAPSEPLSEVKTIAERDRELGETDVDDGSVDISESEIKKLHNDDSGAMDDQPSSLHPKRHSPERD